MLLNLKNCINILYTKWLLLQSICSGVFMFSLYVKCWLLLYEKTLCFPILKCLGDRKYTVARFLFFVVNFLEKKIPLIFRVCRVHVWFSLYNVYRSDRVYIKTSIQFQFKIINCIVYKSM